MDLRQGRLEVPCLFKQIAQVNSCIGMLWIQSQDLDELVQRNAVLFPASTSQEDSEREMSLGEIGLELYRRSEGFDSFNVLALSLQNLC
jgi:hypothetical protein